MRVYCITILLIFSVFCPIIIQAQKVILTGKAPSYAGGKLTFYRTSDWITGTEEVVCTAIVSDSGTFYAEVPSIATEQLFIYLGIYQGYFYVEPGKSYDLVFPERRDKSPDNILNPYFEPVQIHLGMTNFQSDDLNMLIVMFDDAFIPYYDKHVNTIYSKPDYKKLDEDIRQMEEPFAKYKHSYFEAYRKYHYGILKMLSNSQRVQSLSDEYFNNQPVLYRNTAYADLFNQVFDKYFIFFGRTESGGKIFDDINNQGSYAAVLNTLSRNQNFSNDTLTELVLLKQLHDEYYGSQFSRNGLLNILDSLTIRTTIEEHRRIAQLIKTKITRLQQGYEPPPFELNDTEGNTVKLSDFKGRYVYLNFCTCQSYSCLNEFNMLSELYRKHKDRLAIITVTTDPQEDVLKQFLTKNNYSWLFLHYDKQPSILKEYDIRAYPTYFLIGPDGKLILSPAASPAENFEQRLFEIMKSRGDL